MKHRKGTFTTHQVVMIALAGIVVLFVALTLWQGTESIMSDIFKMPFS